ncbi:MAG: DUF4139 domain-containing protein [Cellvibrio sp.]|nr:DUF4139 domain-containing protein [Cellvibrio sp.]
MKNKIVLLLILFVNLVMADSSELTLTVYNEDLALIEDKRQINLQKGKNHIEFIDVSPLIRPETVSLKADGITILEQNFDFDLLTPEKLMEKSVNQEIRIVRVNPGNGNQVTEKAKVLSVNQGAILDINGQIEILRADSIPTRVIFDKIPSNLRSKPTLSIDVLSKKDGLEAMTLSYLSTGITWKSDYVALFDEKNKSMDIQGWLTLTNKTGISFSDIKLQVIAGEIYLSDSEDEFEKNYKQKKSNAVFYAGDQQKSELLDYYIYKIPNRTTIENNQSKQIGFMEMASVKSEKFYSYESSDFSSRTDSEPVEVGVKFVNGYTDKYGFALPAGIIRVYIRDVRGNPTFIGESSINHTPVGAEVFVRTGQAFDVLAKSTLVSEEQSGSKIKYVVEYEFYNARSHSVEVLFNQENYHGRQKIIDYNLPPKTTHADLTSWVVPIGAKEKFVLKFTAVVEKNKK